MRIAIVANTSFNITNFRMGLMKELKNAGHHVIAVAPEDSHSYKIKEAGFDFFSLNKMSRKGTNPFNDLLLISEFYHVYKDIKPDVVLQYTIKPNIYGSIAAFFSGVYSICTVTGLGYIFLNKGFASFLAKWLYRIAFLLSEKVLFQNEDDRELFLKLGLVSDKKSSVISGSGIDTNYFSASNCSQKVLDHEFTFVMIARLLIDKGVREYVEAVQIFRSKYPNAICLLVGDLDLDNPSGISKEELNNWIHSNNISYLGFVNDTREVICSSDVVVLPSYREGIPRVILEGMSMSKPCVTTDAPGCRHTVLDGYNGFICKVADSTSLAQCMEKIYLLPEADRLSMGKNARDFVEQKFDINKVTNEYMELLHQLNK